MIAPWKIVKEKDKYGIAIHNFHQEASYRIKLNVGETVHILEENGDWFFGYSTKNRALRGIFPKSYIHIKESTVDRSGPTEVIYPNQSHIVQEITSVVREWGQIWKLLYVKNNKNFGTIQQMIYELIRYRSKILSGTLPVDEMKEIKQLVTSKIDTGNKMLDLDMVVRDEHGNILNPEATSAIQLYWQHELATERIKKVTSGPAKKIPKVMTHYSHIFFVSVRNFVCKMGEDAELLMTLYDAKEGRAITESYVVCWSKEGLARDLDQLHNLRVLFTDLGSRDLTRERVYVVCYVIRVGAMEQKDSESKRVSQAQPIVPMSRKGGPEGMRRPFGVAAMDVTLYLSGKIESDEDKHHFLPFLQCLDRDNLDSTLKKIIAIKEITQKEHKGQGLWISLKLLHGDLKQTRYSCQQITVKDPQCATSTLSPRSQTNVVEKQAHASVLLNVREENPHLVLGNVAVARKMGFPEVILPGDVRNDLYLTLVGGEFSKGSKSTERNVEVTVKVCNEKGIAIPGVISMGGGVDPLNEYHSVIYYHEDKPRWQETFKAAIPIEEFKGSHLKFTFKHRSSNEAKDRTERPFAMSFVNLMQPNGTTLFDMQHELLVYKVDHKKYEEGDIGYLNLPSLRKNLLDGQKPQSNGLTLSVKDYFLIETNICSTKLTQNVDLLGLLNWTGNPDGLKESLFTLMKVDGEEVVKFLQDVLDALFNILMQNSDSDLYDKMVFECLLFIIGLVSDRKYQHFQPILDLYIQESFSATLAYQKLIVVLKYYIDNANSPGGQEILLKTMKSLQYCMKFIVRSRQLFSVLYEGKHQEEFEASLKSLLQSITGMMCYKTDSTLLVQGACLKYLPTTIPDILKVFDSKELSLIMTDLINKLSPNRLTKQKMMTVNEIVHSDLFHISECRGILIPVIIGKVKDLLESKDENWKQVELCVKILSDIMELLFRKDIGSTVDDISHIMLIVLRTVIQTTIAMDREGPLVGNLVAVMIAIFRQMTPIHFQLYINHFRTNTDLLDFLMEILLVFKDMVSRPVFAKDWCEMIMLQNSVILKSLRYFSHTIRDRFSQNFEQQAWSNFFHCAIAFLTQPALQLDNFSQNKRSRIIMRYKDMRRETGFEIRSMWFNLGQYKIHFVPSLVGPFLEMTLIPETELRKATIPIFFDMMQCEFYSSRNVGESFSDTKRDSTNIKANFSEFENEMIAKLDILVEGGRGDEHYKDLFYTIMYSHCDSHATMKDLGIKFVKTVTRLMERLLEYRFIINDENKENRMSCTVNLLDFYSEINRKEMYIRYVNKLCDLHLECDNYTEAAFTLRLHSKLLNWSDNPLPTLLKSNRYPHCQTHRELKENLYDDIIEYFDKGKMWEYALDVCKELVKEYESETYDYNNLSVLLQKMSLFYDNIMKQMRAEPEYFRVAYYGRGFPAFLQNKVFIYRGKPYERLSDFCSRTLNQLPNAELMNKLTPPGDEITESPHQYVQINKVDPVMDERKRFSGKPVCDQILRYHRVNDVQKFRFSRPIRRKDPNKARRSTAGVVGDTNSTANVEENEFANLWLARTVLVTSYPLPGILRWFPVTSADTYEISPLQNAIETMETTEKVLRDLIVAHRNDTTLTLPLNPLSLKLNGIVDAAVNGGVANYEKAFFTADYAIDHPEDQRNIEKLKNLIAEQIPLLEIGIQLHGQRAPQSLQPFHQRLEQCFNEMRANIEHKYGKKTCDLKFEIPQSVVMRKNFNRSTSGSEHNRLSEVSISSSDGSRSRVSSLTRSQVTTLKSFANFNFTQSFSNLNSNNVTSNSNTNSAPVSGVRNTVCLKSSSSRAQIFVRPGGGGGGGAGGALSPTSKGTTSGGGSKRDKHKGGSMRSSSRKVLSAQLTSSGSLSSGGGNSQWYTSASSPVSTPVSAPIISNFTASWMSSDGNHVDGSPPTVFELRQELTPKRPLRSEVERERRLSRPSSGQFQLSKVPFSAEDNGSTPSPGPTSPIRLNGNGSNRDSIATTDSTASEEDAGLPPPLPVKAREADYCNLPDDSLPPLPRPAGTPTSTPRVRNKPPPPEPVDENGPPPTPPPKRPHLRPPTETMD
ncbi:dedicator of cytokinesis protein 1 isoform X4 [Ischnura elegans]|uniref:dedicator of cytokinesis protein 1 isoform X4 n=1 Tax=Ischnura elegans TaxID=197161 RepID=UPI001ED8A4B9|nr:dedicator of cytokinesis protein 1 isoform X4 [Ischnura elegans]